VRELKNAVQRAFILADDEIAAELLPTDRPNEPLIEGGNGLHLRVGMSIAEAEKRLILATLDGHARNMKRTAEVLGISLKTLYNRMNEYKREGGFEPGALIADETESSSA
jgi:DNA-binding NtrC family response regulator